MLIMIEHEAIIIVYYNTVEPTNKGHSGNRPVVICLEVQQILIICGAYCVTSLAAPDYCVTT